jgi:hypothetical protein
MGLLHPNYEYGKWIELLCRFWGSQNRDHENYYFFCKWRRVVSRCSSMFRRNVMPPFSGSESNPQKDCFYNVGLILRLDWLRQYVPPKCMWVLPNYTASHSRRQCSSGCNYFRTLVVLNLRDICNPFKARSLYSGITEYFNKRRHPLLCKDTVIRLLRHQTSDCYATEDVSC